MILGEKFLEIGKNQTKIKDNLKIFNFYRSMMLDYESLYFLYMNKMKICIV